MVYDVEALIKRMTAGESVEQIAAEMTDMLNAANTQYQKAVQEAEAKAQAARVQNDKRVMVNDILRDIVAFMKRFYPDMYKDMTKSLDEEDKNELWDVVVDAAVEALDEVSGARVARPNFMADPFTMAFMANMLTKPHAPDKQPQVKKSDEDILNDFLKQICH